MCIMNGCSDNWQSVIVAISSALIVIGTIPVNTIPDEYRWLFGVIGIIGFTIKEKLGTKASTPT